MKKIALLAFVLVLLSTALSLFVVGLLELQIAYASPYTSIDVDTAYDMITNGSYPDLVVLDVRTQIEYDGGHIYGAVWIPVSELEARIGELAGHENHEMIVYCASGGRSLTASGILDSHNFTKVYNMLGGISAWESAGYPVWIATVHNVNTTFNYDTIQAAIDAPKTSGGHMILVDAGIYFEQVVVNKSISLIGEDKHNTIIDGNGTGTVVYVTANNVTISSLTLQNGGYGIWLYSSSNSTILGNNASSNNWGIFVEYSSNSTVSGNTVSLNKYWGIVVYYSSDDTILGNNISNNDYGIVFDSSSNSTISGNNVYSNNYDGINFGPSSNNNTLVGNNASNNGGHGIYVEYSSDNTITGNTVTDNAVDGIDVYYSSGNSITGNNVTNNWRNGISLQISSGNSLSRNIITYNARYGIWLAYGANRNTICHNNFIDNRPQILEDSYNNTWDNGYPSGGNYWSNYTGVDVKSGPYQNVTGSDGIGDTPYEIDGNNQDNYPLMGMFSSFNTSLGYDVNVISNSTVQDFQYFESNSTIKITVSNMTANQTHGFCRLTVNHDLLSPTYTVIINDTVVPYTPVFENETLSIIYFSYEHSTLEIIVIPEFPTGTSILLLLIVLTVAIAVYKRRLIKTPIH